jgi:hypothetical protein
MAAGILTVFVIAAYFAASLAQVISAIEWMQYFSPYYYADPFTVLEDGIVWWHALALSGAALLLLGAAVLAFRGREIGASAWQPLAWAGGR